MKKVKNQHYIPQSYLKGFASRQGKEWYVYSRIKNGSIIKSNIRNICSEGYLYDIPELGKEYEQVIETLYSTQVDGNFHEILEFAWEESNEFLSEEMRGKIILSCVSLLFRTPAFLNCDRDYDELQANWQGGSEDVNRKRKIIALQDHLSKSIDLIKQKHNDGISINRAPIGHQFITSDNPVILRNPSGTVENYFDAGNIFHIPISPEFCITIMPTKHNDLKSSFERYSFNIQGVHALNHDIEKYHQQFLIGAKDGIEEYGKNKEIYDNPTSQGFKMLDDSIKMIDIMSQLENGVNSYGIHSEEFKRMMIRFWDNEPTVREDENYIRLMKDLGLN